MYCETKRKCTQIYFSKTYLPSLHVQFIYRRARQRCFRLLAFISRPQVRNIHLPGRMILPGSLILWDKYFFKNLTFVVRISTRVATSPSQSNSLRGQDEEQQLKKQCHCLLKTSKKTTKKAMSLFF